MVKIMLERINIQEKLIVETLLDSKGTGLVISWEFTRKQGFKMKKIERPIYVRNMDGRANRTYGRSQHLLSEIQKEDRNKCN